MPQKIIIKYGVTSLFRHRNTSHVQEVPRPVITDETIEIKVSRYAASSVSAFEERIHRKVVE